MTTPEEPTEGQVLANAAVELLWRGIQSGRYALAYVDSLGVIERHRFVDVAQQAAQWAEALRRHGIASGSRVVVLAGRDRHWRSALLGVVETGAVAVPYAAAVPSTALVALSVDVEAAAIVSALPRPDVAEELGLSVLCPADLDRRHTRTAATPAAPDAFALILQADGAAGAHGAAHTHASLLGQAEAGASLLGLQKGELCWSTLPDGSAESVWLALAAWQAGAELLVVQDDVTPEAHLELLGRLRPAFVWFSDGEYSALASAQGTAGANLASIRLAYTSGEPADGAFAFAGLVGITAASVPAVGNAAVIEPAVPKVDGELLRAEKAGRTEEERRLAAVLKQTEKERLQAEKKAQRRAAQQAKDREKADRRRSNEEDKQRKLAEKAERRREAERVRIEEEARRREEREAEERQKEARRRLEQETKQVKLAKKAEQEAERRQAEEERRRARAAVEDLKRAEAAAHAEASRRAADEKRQEDERRRNEQAARRREAQQARERQEDAERRAKDEAKRSKLAQRNDRVAERRRVEEERRRLRADERRRREEAKAGTQAEREAEQAPRRAETAEPVNSADDRRAEPERLSQDVISLLSNYGITNTATDGENGARGQRGQPSGPSERREAD